MAYTDNPDVVALMNEVGSRVHTLLIAHRSRDHLQQDLEHVVNRQRAEIDAHQATIARLSQEVARLTTDNTTIRAANGAAVLECVELVRVLEEVRARCFLDDDIAARVTAVLDTQHPGAALKAEIDAMQAELDALRAQHQEVAHA